jgi:hypothetical protein
MGFCSRRTGRSGSDIVGFRAGRRSDPSSCFREGLSGRAGSMAGSYSGALMRNLGPVVALPFEAALKPVLVETVEKEERVDATDDTDSFDFFRLRLKSVARRGGSAGGGFAVVGCEGLLGGSKGGGFL